MCHRYANIQSELTGLVNTYIRDIGSLESKVPIIPKPIRRDIFLTFNSIVLYIFKNDGYD